MFSTHDLEIIEDRSLAPPMASEAKKAKDGNSKTLNHTTRRLSSATVTEFCIQLPSEGWNTKPKFSSILKGINFVLV
jgi:hypothetical protein